MAKTSLETFRLKEQLALENLMFWIDCHIMQRINDATGNKTGGSYQILHNANNHEEIESKLCVFCIDAEIQCARLAQTTF